MCSIFCREQGIEETGITIRQDINAATAEAAQPRAIGAMRVVGHLKSGKSCLANLRQSGALKLLFPRRVSGLEAVMINTAGGITGGDRFSISVEAVGNCHMTLTTQAAERVYRAQPGQTGRMDTRLRVGTGARLNWMPQETILYNHCSFQRHLTANLAKDATLLVVEPLVFGRIAMGEVLSNARFNDCIDIRRNGQRLYYDAVRLHGDITAKLSRPAVANGANAMANLIFTAPDAGRHLTFLRDALPDTGGVSLIGDDLLVLRMLAKDSFVLRKSLLPILDRLTDNGLPLCWRL
ncbi:urease accessory protein UreD [Parasedimentitalea maritima]|nr:urease accessory protein UreD [Zongyanglinia marina]